MFRFFTFIEVSLASKSHIYVSVQLDDLIYVFTVK